MTTCPICGAKINTWGGYYVMGPENQGPRSSSEKVCSVRCLVAQQIDQALLIERRLGEYDGAAKPKKERHLMRRLLA